MSEAVDVSGVLVSVSAVVAGGSVAAWAIRSARSQVTAKSAPSAPLPVRFGPLEVAGLLVVAGGLAAYGSTFLLLKSMEQVAALALVLAVCLRLYRFARAGPAALDRLAAALVLVPATALLAGAALVFLLAARPLTGWVAQWWMGYLAAGLVTLGVGWRWRARSVD